MKRLLISLIVLLCATFSLYAENGFYISGKMRTLRPATIQIKDLNNKVVLTININTNGVFRTSTVQLVPDVYKLCIGTVEQELYFENEPLTINGYFDNTDPEKSMLSFKGLEAFQKVQTCLPDRKHRVDTIPSNVIEGLSPSMASAVAYFANTKDYNTNKRLLDVIPQNARTSLAAQWLERKVETLSHQLKGAVAPDFTFNDQNGKPVSLKDFRGKTIVLDFCASWCGPCRKEMRSLLNIYKELKDNSIEFISISLDDEEAKWRQMLKEENLPWVMLWDKTGFPKSSKTPTPIQTAYGFYSIPFLVIIDKSGHIIARNVRGEKVREILLEIKNK